MVLGGKEQRVETIGTITKAAMLEMQRRHISPKDAVQAIIAEAERRNPGKAIVIQPDGQGGCSVIAL